jgi:hypothetical protein
MNCCVRSDFGGLTVLQGSSGDQVSFNTTVGGGVALLKITVRMALRQLCRCFYQVLEVELISCQLSFF